MISQSLNLVRDGDKVKLGIDIDRVRDIVKTIKPKNTRDEYYQANINVKVVSVIQDTLIEQDSFTV